MVVTTWDADADGDSSPNGHEYFPGTDPRSSRDPPRVSLNLELSEDGQPLSVLRFRRLTIADATNEIERSSDLLEWAEVGNDMTVVSEPVDGESNVEELMIQILQISNADTYYRLILRPSSPQEPAKLNDHRLKTVGLNRAHGY